MRKYTVLRYSRDLPETARHCAPYRYLVLHLKTHVRQPTGAMRELFPKSFCTKSCMEVILLLVTGISGTWKG